VRRLVDETQQEGSHRVLWDGKDGNGRNLGSGLYLANLRAGRFSSRFKILLVR
jgi:flagellar hook assembly protein FlgD